MAKLEAFRVKFDLMQNSAAGPIGTSGALPVLFGEI